MDYTRRHDIGPVTLDVSPTYTSTDLLTPVGVPTRVTLPAIAKFDRSLTEDSGKWGTITVTSVTPTRADVTHRRYGCGAFNYDASHQGYKVTSLMLSRCRKNDQLLFSPEKGRIHERQVLLPFPRQISNASHVSRLSIFPDPFQTISQTASLTQLSDKEKILKSLRQTLYCTTGYKDMYKAHLVRKEHNSMDIVQDSVITKDEGGSSILEEATAAVESVCADTESGKDVVKEKGEQHPPSIIIVSSKSTQTDIKDLKLEFPKTIILHCTNTNGTPPLTVKERYSLHVKCTHTDESQRADATTQTAPCVTALVKTPRIPADPSSNRLLFPPHLPPCIPQTHRSGDSSSSWSEPPVVCFQLDSPLTMRFRAQLEFNKKYGESSTVRINKRAHFVAR